MQLLTTEEAARRLSVTPETVRRYIRGGQMHAVKLGRAVRVEESEVAAFVERFKVNAQAPREVAPDEAKAHGFGFLKGRLSSDAFLEEKHAQAKRERERDEARQEKRSEVAA